MNNIRIILMLLLAFLLIVSGLLWHFFRLQSDLVNSTALRTAELYSVALTEFRTLYTSEVVSAAMRHGLDVTHDYVSRDKAIPLPATLSMRLGEEIGKYAAGAKARLYSPYPFPWRAKEAVDRDRGFEDDAWRFLLKYPDQPFSRFDREGSETMLRYATADIMRPPCVACHNSHPDTPKSDWKIGDVRGVLAISLPLGNIVAQTESNLKSTSVAYITIGFGIVLVIGTVIIKLRQQSQELQYRVAAQTIKLEARVAERGEAMAALAEIEKRNRLLLDSAGEGIYGLDLDGKTTFVNPAACKMLGYEAEELLGESMHALVHHSHSDGSVYPQELCPMNSSCTDGKIRREEGEVLWRKDGSSFPIEYTSTPLKKDDELVGAVVVFNDVSERKKVERMKDEFVSTVSHELRTPLTSIKGALGLIVGGQLGDVPEKVMEMLRIAHDNSDRLALLINDLLDINKIQSIEKTFRMLPIRINALISTAVDSNQGSADKYGVQFHWQPSESDDVTVSGDESRLIQALSNLLSNAVKYSPTDGRVRISTRRDNNEVRVSIQDSGPGIPLEFQARVFEKFSQADSSDTRQMGGTGLGLALAKQIIEAHGGRIGFASEPGQGATFYFDLPIVMPAERGV